jgi:hypothetical protein
VQRWLDLWNSYWFPVTTTLSLSLSRIIAVAAQLLWFFPELDFNLILATKNSEFTDPQPLIRAISAIIPRSYFATPDVLSALYWITLVAGVGALIGLLTRASLAVFTFGIWFFVSHQYSYADIHHGEAVFGLFLLALTLAPSGKSLSVDALIARRRSPSLDRSTAEFPKTDTAMWPLKLAQVLLAMTYFSTGATKLIDGGLAWMNGYTLQTINFSVGIQRGLPVGIWLGQHYTLSLILSVFTILFEVFFFLSLFFPRVAPLFFAGGILFHIGLHLAGGHGFFQHIVLLLLLLLFLDPRRVEAWWSKYVRRAPKLNFRLAEPQSG